MIKTRWNYLSKSYVHGVRKAGGIPMLLPATEDPNDALQAQMTWTESFSLRQRYWHSRLCKAKLLAGTGAPQTLRVSQAPSLLPRLLKTDKPIRCPGENKQ